MNETIDHNRVALEGSWHIHFHRAILAKHEVEIVGHLHRAVKSVPDDEDHEIKKCYYDFALQMLHRRKITDPGLGLNIDFVVRHAFLDKLLGQSQSSTVNEKSKSSIEKTIRDWTAWSDCLKIVTQPYIDSSGNKYWKKRNRNDQDHLHRLDGPAIEYTDGSREFFIDGVNLTLDEFLAHPKRRPCTIEPIQSKKQNTYVSPFTGKIT